MQNLQEIKLVDFLLHDDPIELLIPLILYPKLLEERPQFLLADELIHLIDVLAIVIGVLEKPPMDALMYLIDIVVLAVEDLL